MPRHFKLTEDKKRRVLRLVMEGETVQQAAKRVGCSSRTVRRAAQQDAGFAWRLKTARETGRELRRREDDLPPSPETTIAELFEELEQELRRLWLAAEEGADTPATPDTATT